MKRKNNDDIARVEQTPEECYNLLIELKKSIGDNPLSKQMRAILLDSFVLAVTNLNQFLSPTNSKKQASFHAWLKNKNTITTLSHLTSVLGSLSNKFKKIYLSNGEGLTVEMQLLIEHFINSHPQPKDLGQFLWGLSFSANLFANPLEHKLVQELLGVLNNESLTSNDLASSLYNLTRLVVKTKLINKIDASSLQKPLDIILLKGWMPSTINCLRSISILAGTKQLQLSGDFYSKSLSESMGTSLQNVNSTIQSQAIAKLGQIASFYDKCLNKVDGDRVQKLIDKALSSSDLMEGQARGFIHGLSRLAESQHLQGKLDAERFEMLLKPLLLNSNFGVIKSIKDFFNSAQNLGKAKALYNQFNAVNLQKALQVFLAHSPKTNLIMVILVSLKTLIGENLIGGKVDKLVQQFISGISIFNFSFFEIGKLITTLDEMKFTLPEEEAFKLMKRALAHARAKNVVENIDSFLDNLIRFRHYETLEPLFIESMKYVAHSKLSLKESSASYLNRLSDKPSWRKALQATPTKTSETGLNSGRKPLSLPKNPKTQSRQTISISAIPACPDKTKPKQTNRQPTRQRNTTPPLQQKQPNSDVRKKARNNPIFDVILNRSLLELQKILGLEGAELPESREHPAKHSLQSRPSPDHLIERLGDKADGPSAEITALINDFFEQTPSDAMRILVENSDYLKFSFLLTGCSIKQRYDLALRHLLDPLLNYLPIDDLGELVSNMVPLRFQCNSEAGLCIVRALSTRAKQKKEEAGVIQKIQQNFLDAMQLHHRNHEHVLLNIERARIIAQIPNFNQDKPPSTTVDKMPSQRKRSNSSILNTTQTSSKENSKLSEPLTETEKEFQKFEEELEEFLLDSPKKPTQPENKKSDKKKIREIDLTNTYEAIEAFLRPVRKKTNPPINRQSGQEEYKSLENNPLNHQPQSVESLPSSTLASLDLFADNTNMGSKTPNTQPIDTAPTPTFSQPQSQEDTKNKDLPSNSENNSERRQWVLYEEPPTPRYLSP